MSVRPPIHGIVFDKDGTLLDYEASWRPINARAAAIASRGDAELAVQLLAVGGADPYGGGAKADGLLAAGNTAEIAAAWIAAGAPGDVIGLTVELDALFRSAADTVVPAGDLRSIFGSLHEAGYVLGVASSDNEAAIRATLVRFEVDRLVAFVAGYDSGHGTKPGPGMVLGFCRATKIDPTEVAVVGDNRHDLLMGRAAGAGMTVGVLTGTGTKETLAGLADAVLDSIADLGSLLIGSAPRS